MLVMLHNYYLHVYMFTYIYSQDILLNLLSESLTFTSV